MMSPVLPGPRHRAPVPRAIAIAILAVLVYVAGDAIYTAGYLAGLAYAAKIEASR